MAEATKNLCAKIPIALHDRVREEQEKAGQTLSAYITALLTEYYNNERGEKIMEKMRTLAFQIPESLYDRLKNYLDSESRRTGQKITQKDFVLGLIQQVLDGAAED